MGIVLTCANSQRLVVKCDGREKSEHGAVLSENQLWYTQFSDKCIIGYSGDKMVCEMLITALHKALEEQDRSNSFEITEELQKLLMNTTDTTEDCSFIIAGIFQGRTHLYGMSYQDHFASILDKSPIDEDIICENLIIGSQILSSAESFSQQYDTKKSIEANMNGYIRYISSMDDSVNTNISTCKLKVF